MASPTVDVGAEVRVKSEGRIGTVLVKDGDDILVKFSDGTIPRTATFNESENALEVVAPALQVSATRLGSDGGCADVCQFTLGRCGTVGDARSKVEDAFDIPWGRILLQDASGAALVNDLKELGELAQDGTVVLTVASLPETVEFCIQVSKELGRIQECTVEVRILSSVDDLKRTCLYDNGLQVPESSTCLFLPNGHALLANDNVASLLGPSPDFALPELFLGRAADTVELLVSLGLAGEELKFFASRDWKVIDIKRHIESTIDLQAPAFTLLFEGRTLIDDEVFLTAVPELEQIQLQLLQTGSEVFFLGTVDMGEIECGKFKVAPPETAADLQLHRRCLVQYFQQEQSPVNEEVLDTCPVEVMGNPENLHDFCKGIVDPPYGGEPMSRYQDKLTGIYGGTEAVNKQLLTVYSWTEDYENPDKNFCPEFFQAGLEWWGVSVHTVGNKETGQVGVFACSLTD